MVWGFLLFFLKIQIGVSRVFFDMAWITHCHHKAYLVDALRQALNGRTVELVEMEELRSDKCTLPSFPYDDKKKKKRIASAGENVPSAGAGAGAGEARRGDDGEPATPLRRSIRRKL